MGLLPFMLIFSTSAFVNFQQALNNFNNALEDHDLKHDQILKGKTLAKMIQAADRLTLHELRELLRVIYVFLTLY